MVKSNTCLHLFIYLKFGGSSRKFYLLIIKIHLNIIIKLKKREGIAVVKKKSGGILVKGISLDITLMNLKKMNFKTRAQRLSPSNFFSFFTLLLSFPVWNLQRPLVSLKILPSLLL